MASAFGHALTAFTMGKTFPKNMSSRKFIILGILCSIIPDADVITFTMGIPYETPFWTSRIFSFFFICRNSWRACHIYLLSKAHRHMEGPRIDALLHALHRLTQPTRRHDIRRAWGGIFILPGTIPATFCPGGLSRFHPLE
jgi:hypothetical protein